MNALQQYVRDNRLNETTVMNELQDAGIVSENAVNCEDVALADCPKAIWFLARYHKIDMNQGRLRIPE